MATKNKNTEIEKPKETVVVDLDARKSTKKEHGEPLFILDGKTHYARANIPVKVMLNFLENSRNDEYDGDVMTEMLRDVVGSEVYDVIRESDDIDIEAFGQIMERVQDLVFQDFTGK